MVGLKVLAFLSEYGKNMSENWVKRSVSVMMVSNLWIEIMTPVIGTCHWDKLQYLPRPKSPVLPYPWNADASRSGRWRDSWRSCGR